MKKPASPEELIKKTRRVFRDPEPEELPLPPGFAHRAVSHLSHSPSGHLILWERSSYAGVAVAAAFSLLVWLGTPVTESKATGNAADPWLDMPMNTSAL